MILSMSDIPIDVGMVPMELGSLVFLEWSLGFLEVSKHNMFIVYDILGKYS